MFNYLKNMDRNILTFVILLLLVGFYFGINAGIFAFFLILVYGMIEELLDYLFGEKSPTGDKSTK